MASGTSILIKTEGIRNMDNSYYNNAQNYQPQGQPVQPIYQDPAQYQQPVQYPSPYFQGTQEEMADRKKKANTLCIISLLLRAVPYITGIITAFIERFNSITNLSEITTTLTGIISFATGGTYIASWVLLIIARVKYKESRFAKVLMIVYICELVVTVIAVIILVVWCMIVCQGCQNFPG